MKLRKTNEVLADNANTAKMIRKILKLVGKKAIPDIVNNGMQGGFNGFIWDSDNVLFFRRYRSEIISTLKAESESDLIAIATDCLNHFRLEVEQPEVETIAQTLYGCDAAINPQVAAALVWAAVEQVANKFNADC